MGTAAYMSPEQASGKPVDKRADIWAFGVILFEMLTGKRAFDGETVSHVLAAVLNIEPDWAAVPAKTPAAIQRLLRRCLAKERRRRVPDMGMARFEIGDALEARGSDKAHPVANVQLQLWQRPIPLVVVGLGLILTSGLAVWSGTRPGPPFRPQPVRFEIVTPPDGRLTMGGPLRDVGISPDGTSVVWASLATVGGPLYLRTIDQFVATPLRGSDGGRSPIFSPAGDQVIFVQGNTLSRVSASGGLAVTICTFVPPALGVSWGLDDEVVFGTGTPGGLWRVDATGGEPAQLTSTESTGRVVNHAWPHILPGGRAVLFTILTGGTPVRSYAGYGTTGPLDAEQAQIAVLNLDTGETTVLVDEGSQPAYSATGHIVYARDGAMWAVGFDRHRLELTAAPTPVLEDVNTKTSGAANFSLSADGSIVYVPGAARDNRDQSRSFVWVDREGRGEVAATGARAYQEFTLSPDGRQVAVYVDGEVWILDLVRGGPGRRLTRSPRGRERSTFGPRYPTWTPDGLRVAFGRDSPLSWMAADGTGGVEQLMESGNPLAFTPDGTALVYNTPETVTRGLAQDLGVLALTGDRTSSLLWGETPYSESHADLSPDGRWLAYETYETGQSEVIVKPFPNVGDGGWQLTASGGKWPLWNPAAYGGQELLYLGPEGMMAVAINTDTTFRWDPPELLFATAGYYAPLMTSPANRRMDIGPDGSRFLMFTEDDVAAVPGIQVVLNWSEELKERVPVP